jgi:hypothetical protein
MSEEQKISQRYRELPREEPPRHLDDAILAAARRATASRPAPLVAPTGRRRWYFPVAAAAIIVLAVAVTIHMERQERDFELSEQQAAPAQAPAPEPEPLAKREASPPPAAPPRPEAPPLGGLQSSAPEPAAQARESVRADETSRLNRQPEARAAMRSERALEKVLDLAAASPEQWLQGIADLKRQGRNEEAEKQLAEFRKRYPDYRIPEAIVEKFEKR